jgi:hypothetical protein
MKLKHLFDYFKKQEEEKGIYHINIPLLFLEGIEKLQTKKMSFHRRYIYYPAIFFALWF